MLQMEECAKNQKIRVAHQGRCVKRGGKRRRKTETDDDSESSQWPDGSTTQSARGLNERLEGTAAERKGEDRRSRLDEKKRRKGKKKRRRNGNNKGGGRGERKERRGRRRDRAEVSSYS